MRRALLVAAALAALLPGRAWADSDVPSLAAGTVLTSAKMYLANAGATNNSLGLSTSVFDISAGNLTLKAGGVTNAMLAGSIDLTKLGGAVDGNCVFGAGGVWTSAGCSVTGTAGQVTVSPTTGAVVVSLPSTITQNTTFSNSLIAGGPFSATNAALTTPTIAGGATFTGLSAGTQVSCLGLSAGNALVLNAAACGSGGGGTPGGTNGQIQYNNSSSFGGFTMGGDGTLDTSTGALTVSSINGTAPGSFYAVAWPSSADGLGSNGSAFLPWTFSSNFAKTNTVWDLTLPGYDLTSGTPSTISSTYGGGLVLLGAHAYTIAAAGTTGFTTNWGSCFINQATVGSGNATVVATTSVFTGAGATTTLTLEPGASACVRSDNVNYTAAVSHYLTPWATGITGLGTGVATAGAVNVGSAGALVVNGGALGTPSSGSAANLTSIPVANATGTLPVGNGGTGQTAYTNGQLMIGNTATGGLSKATLTAGANVTITNGNGTISIASSGGGGTGCVTAGTLGQVLLDDGAGGCSSAASASISTGALTLGASGTLGSITMGNATTGTAKIQPVAGALGTVTASLPANTGTIAETNLAQTWSAVQTFTPGPVETAVALSGCNGSTATMDMTAGSYFSCTVSAGGVTFAVSNPAATGKVSSFVLELTNPGSQTLTFMSGTKWPGGAQPAWTAAGIDMLVCSTRDAATTWRCVRSEEDTK